MVLPGGADEDHVARPDPAEAQGPEGWWIPRSTGPRQTPPTTGALRPRRSGTRSPPTAPRKLMVTTDDLQAKAEGEPGGRLFVGFVANGGPGAGTHFGKGLIPRRALARGTRTADRGREAAAGMRGDFGREDDRTEADGPVEAAGRLARTHRGRPHRGRTYALPGGCLLARGWTPGA